VTSPPITESSSQSKKRKRPASDTHKLQSAEVNLEKLVKKLKGSSSVDDRGKHREKKRGQMGPLGGKQKAEKQKAKSKVDAVDGQKKIISRPMPLKATEKDSALSPRPGKRGKTKHTAESSSYLAVAPMRKSLDSSTSGLTALQQGMKQSLDGARFR